MLAGRSRLRAADWLETTRKVAIGGRKSSFILATQFGARSPRRFVDLPEGIIYRSFAETRQASMTIFRLKQLASTSVHAAAGAIRWNYDRAELIADGVVHGIGVSADCWPCWCCRQPTICGRSRAPNGCCAASITRRSMC